MSMAPWWCGIIMRAKSPSASPVKGTFIAVCMRATASFIIARKLPAVAGSGLPRAIPPARTIAIRRKGRSTNRRLANILASFFSWPKERISHHSCRAEDDHLMLDGYQRQRSIALSCQPGESVDDRRRDHRHRALAARPSIAPGRNRCLLETAPPPTAGLPPGRSPAQPSRDEFSACRSPKSIRNLFTPPSRTGGADRRAAGGRRQRGEVHVTPREGDCPEFSFS